MKGRIMKRVARVVFVFLLVSSVLSAQRNELLAQSSLPDAEAARNHVNNAPAVSDLQTANAKTASAAWLAARLSVLPSPGSSTTPGNGASAPQGSSSSAKNWGLWAGLAMVGTGIALVARDEPAHQTTCLAYDSCPTPGLVQMSG